MKNAKAYLVLVAGTLSAALPIMMQTTHMGLTEWINVVVLMVGAAVVWNTSNDGPGWPYGKAVGAALISALTMFISFYSGGLSPAEVIQMILAVLMPFGVYALPNKPMDEGLHAA